MRTTLCITLLAGALGAIAAPAYPQGYKPTRPIEIVAHTGPGGGGDLMARAVALAIEKEKLLPVRMQVANKPGGGSAVAMAYLAEKKGDTHTLGIFNTTWVTDTLVSAELKATLRDLTPLVRLVMEPTLFVVKNDSPHKSLKDFIEAAKKAPGQLKQSGGSITGRDNLIRQVLQKHTGASWVFISFPGAGERISALLGGHVNLMVLEPPEAGEHIRSGSMRVIAQVSEKRLPAYPNVPTLQEAGFDVPNVTMIRGIVAPPGISRDEIAYWDELFAKLVQTPTWKKYLEDTQFEEGFQKHAALGKSLDEYVVTMRSLLKEAGVKVIR